MQQVRNFVLGKTASHNFAPQLDVLDILWLGYQFEARIRSGENTV